MDATASFAPGQTEQTLSITVNGDTVDELDESFFIASRGRTTGASRPSSRRARSSTTTRRRRSRSTTSTVTEGNSGSSERELHGQPERDQRPDGDGQLRERRRDGDLAGRLRRGQRRPQLRAGRHLGDDHRAGRRRPARRGRRELHDRALEPGQRDVRGQPRTRHDHRQRRRADCLRRRRLGDRGQQRHRRRDLQRHALRAVGPRGQRRLRDRRGQRERHARFRDRRRTSSTSPPGRPRRRSRCRCSATCSTRRTRRSSSGWATPRTRPSAMRRASGRSATTTLRRRCRSLTPASPKATRAPPRRRFTVSLSAISGQDVSVAYATANDSAVAPADYAADERDARLPGRAIPRRRSRCSSTATCSTRPTKASSLNLTGPRTRRSRDGQGVGTITDDDATPTLSIDDVTQLEGNTGTRTRPSRSP